MTHQLTALLPVVNHRAGRQKKFFTWPHPCPRAVFSFRNLPTASKALKLNILVPNGFAPAPPPAPASAGPSPLPQGGSLAIFRPFPPQPAEAPTAPLGLSGLEGAFGGSACRTPSPNPILRPTPPTEVRFLHSRSICYCQQETVSCSLSLPLQKGETVRGTPAEAGSALDSHGEGAAGQRPLAVGAKIQASVTRRAALSVRSGAGRGGMGLWGLFPIISPPSEVLSSFFSSV